MNYVAQSRRPNPAAMLGALGIPGAFGALLVVGLAVTVTKKAADERLIALPDTPDIPVPPPPPPKPDNPAPTNPTTPAPAVEQVVVVPNPPINLGPTLPIETGTLPPIDADLIPPVGGLGGSGTIVEPPAPPMPDPIAASPRNAPGGWITDSDYRPRWIREGREGKARFQLEISASGRVSNCEILSSTGHTVLDLATCRLITRRARFEPARDSSGAKVTGSFSSSINWKIPE